MPGTRVSSTLPLSETLPRNIAQVVSPSRFLFVVLLLIGMLPSGAVDSEYDRYIAEARAGHTDAALGYLEQRLQRNPRDRRALNDYIVILGWAERHADAYALRTP